MSSLLPRVEARARCAAASPPERRSQELSGGGCRPVDEPRPLSPRLIAGFNNSASADPIGCTSGRDALEFGALDFGVLTGFFGASGFFAMAGIWDESGAHERAKGLCLAFALPCQQVAAWPLEARARGRASPVPTRHCEPTGPREARPDDRLREAIHSFFPRWDGLLRRFASRNDDWRDRWSCSGPQNLSTMPRCSSLRNPHG
jgi:hypothetical protein